MGNAKIASTVYCVFMWQKKYTMLSSFWSVNTNRSRKDLEQELESLFWNRSRSQKMTPIAPDSDWKILHSTCLWYSDERWTFDWTWIWLASDYNEFL